MKIALSVFAACGLVLAGCSTPAPEENAPASQQSSSPVSSPTTVAPGTPIRPEEVTVILINDEGHGWSVAAYRGSPGILLALYSTEIQAKACREKLDALVKSGQTIFSANSDGSNQAC